MFQFTVIISKIFQTCIYSLELNELVKILQVEIILRDLEKFMNLLQIVLENT